MHEGETDPSFKSFSSLSSPNDDEVSRDCSEIRPPSNLFEGLASTPRLLGLRCTEKLDCLPVLLQLFRLESGLSSPFFP